jgi:hypothetical protein
MKLYRFSPVTDQETLIEAIRHIHVECYKLCKTSLGEYLPTAGNVGFFCHYDDEYEILTKLRKDLTEESDNVNQKYYRLHEPIVIGAVGDIPETVYTHLYIRKPDIYRAQVGDVDFVMESERYGMLKERLLSGEAIPGARVFPRNDLDMIELFNPDVDALGYISVKEMTEKVRVKVSG